MSLLPGQLRYDASYAPDWCSRRMSCPQDKGGPKETCYQLLAFRSVVKEMNPAMRKRFEEKVGKDLTCPQEFVDLWVRCVYSPKKEDCPPSWVKQ